MNIHEALKKVSIKRAEYFKWKHDLYWDNRQEKRTEKEFLKLIQAKTLNSYVRWERSKEYKSLLLLLLESKVANDFEKIYEVVSEKAKDGDEKYIKLFLSMQKDLDQQARLASEALTIIEDDEEEDSGLDLN